MANLPSRHAIPALHSLMADSGVEVSAAGFKRLQVKLAKSYPSHSKIERIVYHYDLMRHPMACELIGLLNNQRSELGKPPYEHTEQIVEFDTRIRGLGSLLGEHARRQGPQSDLIDETAMHSGLPAQVIQLMCGASYQYLVPNVIGQRIALAAASICRVSPDQLHLERLPPVDREATPIPLQVRRSIFEAINGGNKK
jgi:hypothetical protein